MNLPGEFVVGTDAMNSGRFLYLFMGNPVSIAIWIREATECLKSYSDDDLIDVVTDRFEYSERFWSLAIDELRRRRLHDSTVKLTDLIKKNDRQGTHTDKP